MADQELDFKDIERRMTGALSSLKTEFGGLRTGRASAALLDTVVVDAYGTPTPISQVGTVSVPEPRMITVQVWDKANVGATEKAIRNAGLGLNPSSDGLLVRIPIPMLNEERRAELTKVAGKYAESARIAIRNVRRDGMEELKLMEKKSQISKDEHKAASEKVQKVTDRHIGEVDAGLASKEEEIMQV